MTCWCKEYHSYELGTKKLTICEHSCHATDKKWRATQYTENITYIRSEPLPPRPPPRPRWVPDSPIFLHELHVDEEWIRWIFWGE
jgi:hypothetical protein